MGENRYHGEYNWSQLDDLARALGRESLRPQAQQLVDLGRAGTLTRVVLRRMGLGNRYGMDDLHFRDFFNDTATTEIYTVGYLDSLERVLRGKRVLEVCAGRGVLARLMQGRGLDWTATDLHPVTDDVQECEALAAVSIFKPEVIVASWIPYGSDLDQRLAETGIPMVLIGEGHGGCTGSEGLWQRGRESYYDSEVDDYVDNEQVEWAIHGLSGLFEWFEDVPQFSGIHDYTSLVLPVGSVLIVEGHGVFGPTV
jgi:hypothetical protein